MSQPSLPPPASPAKGGRGGGGGGGGTAKDSSPAQAPAANKLKPAPGVDDCSDQFIDDAEDESEIYTPAYVVYLNIGSIRSVKNHTVIDTTINRC